MAAKSTRGVTSETQKLEMLKALTFGRNDWCGLSSLFCYNLMCLSHQEKGRWVRKLVIQLKSAVWRDITDYMKRLGIGPRVVFWPITPCTCYAKLRMFILRVDGKDDPKASGQFQVLRGQYSEYSSYVFASENATLVFATLVFVPWNPGDIGDNHAIGCNRMQELPVSAQLLCWLLLLTQRGWSETEKKTLRLRAVSVRICGMCASSKTPLKIPYSNPQPFLSLSRSFGLQWFWQGRTTKKKRVLHSGIDSGPCKNDPPILLRRK